MVPRIRVLRMNFGTGSGPCVIQLSYERQGGTIVQLRVLPLTAHCRRDTREHGTARHDTAAQDL